MHPLLPRTAHLESGAVSFSQVKIADVLAHTEDEAHTAFLGVNASVYDAIEMFESSQVRGQRLEALLITDSGKADGKLLGLLTIWDLPELYQAIEVPG